MATASLNATNSNTVTITLSSVTNGSTATSSAIDNSTNKFLSANIQVKFKTGASGTSSTGSFSVYLIRSADGGTTYDSTGTLIGTQPATANATTYIQTFPTEPFGPLGTSWKVAVVNNSGGTTDTTAGNHSCVFTGVKYDIA